MRVAMGNNRDSKSNLGKRTHVSIRRPGEHTLSLRVGSVCKKLMGFDAQIVQDIIPTETRNLVGELDVAAGPTLGVG